MQDKHQAGYYKQNVKKDAFNYLKDVLTERKEAIIGTSEKSELISKLKDLEIEEEK